MVKNIGMSALKVGTVLYGYAFGIGAGRLETFHQFEITKVGRDYIYDKYGNKIHIVFNKNSYPQYDTLIAQDENPNHRYNYYKTQSGAEKGLKVSQLRVKLSKNNFRSPTDDTILEIARIMGIN